MKAVFMILGLAFALAAAASDEAKQDKLAECGRVFGVTVGKDRVEVEIHPEGISDPHAGGFNTGFEFTRSEADLEIVAVAAFKALDSKNLKFCMDTAPAHERFGKKRFFVVATP